MNTLSKDAQAYKLALRIACERLAESSSEDAERLFSEIFNQACRLLSAAQNEVA